MWHFAVAGLLLFIGTSPVASQATLLVRGRVVAADSAPIVGALVELTGVGDSTRTSISGEFSFHASRPGRAVLRVRMLGFAIRTESVEVRDPDGWSGTIMLHPIPPMTLPDVSVTVDKPVEYAHTSRYDDFFRRRALGIGTFRTRQDIESKAAFDMVSVLNGIPGVRISLTPNPHGETEVRVQMARCRPPRIGLYVNGQRVELFLSAVSDEGPSSSCRDCVRLYEALSAILLRNVEFVEFYRGPGQIPSDLERGDACAALVIWTR